MYREYSRRNTEKEVNAIVYPLYALRHQFSNFAIKHEGKMASGVAVLCTVGAMIGLANLGLETEDNIESKYASRALERVENETLNLSQQKDAIANIREQQKLLEFGEGDVPLPELEAQESMYIESLKDDAEKTLRYIFTNEDLSEEQISDAWNNISEDIIRPASITDEFENDYDFALIRECRTEFDTGVNKISRTELAGKIDQCLENSKNVSINLAPLGAFMLLMFIPSMIFSESDTTEKWAREKPIKRAKAKPKNW